MCASWWWAVLIALVTLGGVAEAQPAPSDAADVERATALFEEGRELLEAGEVSRACERFRESYELVRGIGVQYNLAGCYARLGRTASAQQHYLEVADVAARTGQAQRAVVARKRAEELESRITRVRITVAEPVDGLVVSVDGVPLSSFERPLPVDPGRHDVEAVAPERRSFRVAVEAGDEGRTIDVRVPVLDVVQASERPVSAELGALSIAGIVVGGVGVLALAGAAVTAGLAKSRDSDAAAFCTVEGCLPDGVALGDEAVGLAHTATGLLIGGSVMAATGIVMLVLGFENADTTARVRPVWFARGAGVAVIGTF